MNGVSTIWWKGTPLPPLEVVLLVTQIGVENAVLRWHWYRRPRANEILTLPIRNETHWATVRRRINGEGPDGVLYVFEVRSKNER